MFFWLRYPTRLARRAQSIRDTGEKGGSSGHLPWNSQTTCVLFRQSKASVTAWTVSSVEENGTMFHYKFPRRTHHQYNGIFLCKVETGPVCCPLPHGLLSAAIGAQFVGPSLRQSTPRADRSLQSVSCSRCSGDLRLINRRKSGLNMLGHGKTAIIFTLSRQLGKWCMLLFKWRGPMQTRF